MTGPEIRRISHQTTPERVIPERMGGRVIHAEHVARYAWAALLAEGNEIVDVGCGVGYGTKMLAEAGAHRVVGVDNSGDAVAQAIARAPRLEFAAADAAALPFPDASFDLLVCFEVIEHLEQPTAAIHEFHRVLRADGVALISTPNADVHPGGNENHLKEYTPSELERLVQDVFAECRLERQHLWAASMISDDERLLAGDPPRAVASTVHKLAGRAPGRETFTLAVASDAPLPELDPLVVLTDTFEIGLWQARLDELRNEMRAAHHELEASRARERQVAETALRATASARELERENAELHELRHRAARLEREVAETRVAQHWLAVIQASLSWRVTSPLRAGARGLRRLTGRSDSSLRDPPR